MRPRSREAVSASPARSVSEPENVCGVDFVDGLLAQRVGVHGQRHAPLRPVLLVAEALG